MQWSWWVLSVLLQIFNSRRNCSMSTNNDGLKGPSNKSLEPADFWPDIIEINAEPRPRVPEVVPPGIVADPIALHPDYPKQLVGLTAGLGLIGKKQREEKHASFPTVVLSHGSGKFARAAAARVDGVSVFTPDASLAGFENQVPLATRSNIERSKEDGSFEKLRLLHPLRFNQWHVMRDCRADRPAHSADLIVVEQAHLSADIGMTVAEIGRLARPGAGFLILGYQRFVVADTPLLNEWMEFKWQTHLNKFMNAGECHLATGFRDLVIPNSHDVYRETGFHDLPKVMTKKLNLRELIAGHLDAWPVVQRLTHGPGTNWHDLMKLRDQMEKLWGAHPKTRKEVRWELTYRIGIIN
jgi:hypothetical protein